MMDRGADSGWRTGPRPGKHTLCGVGRHDAAAACRATLPARATRRSPRFVGLARQNDALQGFSKSRPKLPRRTGRTHEKEKKKACGASSSYHGSERNSRMEEKSETRKQAAKHCPHACEQHTLMGKININQWIDDPVLA